MDPLLSRKDPVAEGCKYHHQVFFAELSLLLQVLCWVGDPFKYRFQNLSGQNLLHFKNLSAGTIYFLSNLSPSNPTASQNLSVNCFQLLMLDCKKQSQYLLDYITYFLFIYAIRTLMVVASPFCGPCQMSN